MFNCLLVLFVLGDGSEEVGEVRLTFAVGNRPLRAGCDYDQEDKIQIVMIREPLSDAGFN